MRPVTRLRPAVRAMSAIYLIAAMAFLPGFVTGSLASAEAAPAAGMRQLNAVSLMGDFVPDPSGADPSSVELGLRLRTSAAGSVTAVRFFKKPENVGTHVGSVWASNGTLLGRATFTDESESGWQQVVIDPPAAISAGQEFVVSYLAPNGNYALDGDAQWFCRQFICSRSRLPARGCCDHGAWCSDCGSRVRH